MSRFTLLAGCALTLLSGVGCSDTSSPVLPAAPSRSVGTLEVYFEATHSGNQFPGQACEWHAYTVGGTPPYTFVWSSYNLDGSGTDNYFYGVSYDVGTYSLTVQVTDADGRTGSKTYNGNTGYEYLDRACSI